MGTCTKIRDADDKKNPITIGTTGHIYQICKTRDHYFAFIEHTNTTAFAFENHEAAIVKSPDNWTTFYCDKWKRDPSRGMSSMALVKKLLVTPGALTPIGADTVGLYGTDSWSRVDRTKIT